MFGISAALTTPFQVDGSVDFARLNAHITAVLREGCASVTFFGTTGEGPSVATDQRLDALRAAIASGVDPRKMLLCLHGAASGDVILQARAALDMGIAKFLLPPPCYYGAAPLGGLSDWYADVFSRLGGTGASFFLYNIPQVIGVGLPVALVKTLKAAFPDTVVGVKDSSGDFDNTTELLKLPGLDILIGDERQLAPGAKLGAAGSISGIANLFADRLNRVLASGEHDTGINHLVDTVLDFSVTPAVKSLVADKYRDSEWHRTLPPLEPVSEAARLTLASACDLVEAP
jgi:4-hydroxy-tetrahydrodipicolinate synthase